jgi:hypothetical protein
MRHAEAVQSHAVAGLVLVTCEAHAWRKPGDSGGMAYCSLVLLLCCSCAPLVLPGRFRRLSGPFRPLPRVRWPR